MTTHSYFNIVLKPTLLCCALISGCTSLPSQHKSAISASSLEPVIAAQFNTVETQRTFAAQNSTSLPLYFDGLGQKTHPLLNKAILTALADNHSIIEQRALFAQAEQRRIISDANLGFVLSLSTANAIATSTASNASTNSNSLSLKGSLEIDVWGKLDAQSRAAQYDLASAKANLRQSEQNLIANITGAWYQLIHQQKLHQLVIEQQQNTDNQQLAIEESYQKGLSDISDVYLARGNSDIAETSTINAADSLFAAARKLQLLLAQYPNGELRIAGELTQLSINYTLGIPANLLTNRADLTASWLAILAQDASVASTYAEQFPSFMLSGDLSLSSAKLSQLFSQNLAWSLLASISQSLVDNGKKAATYQLSRAVLIEREQEYLQALQQSFSQVEGLIDSEKSIAKQVQLNRQILEYAELSLAQIKAQYRNGIANYQQVLSLQHQLFENQKGQLSLQLQQIENRIELLLALGSPDHKIHYPEFK